MMTSKARPRIRKTKPKKKKLKQLDAVIVHHHQVSPVHGQHDAKTENR